MTRLLTRCCLVHFMQPPLAISQAQETVSPCPLLVLRHTGAEHPKMLKISPSSVPEIGVFSEHSTTSALSAVLIESDSGLQGRVWAPTPLQTFHASFREPQFPEQREKA